MTRGKRTGRTCVGDVRLSPLDVGFDLRLCNMAVKLPAAFETVGLDIDGDTYLIRGTREEMIAAIKEAGYEVSEE